MKFVTQATNSMRILKIVIITNSIHAAKKIFDLLLHLFQTHLVSILCELPKFLTLNQDNSIEFWEYPSRCNWSLHKVVNNKTKSFNPSPLFPCKLS